jgi:hypothetical protein
MSWVRAAEDRRTPPLPRRGRCSERHSNSDSEYGNVKRQPRYGAGKKRIRGCWWVPAWGPPLPADQKTIKEIRRLSTVPPA